MSWDKVPKRRGLKLVPERSLELAGRALLQPLPGERGGYESSGIFHYSITPKENVGM